MKTIRLFALLVAATVVAGEAWGQGPVPRSFHKSIAALKKERVRLLPLVRTDTARAFLGALDALPVPAKRVLYYRPRPLAVHTEADALEKLDEAERKAFRRLEWGEAEYYAPLYGTPMGYVRPVDLLAEHGVTDWRGKRVFDFGYGGICQLRLLALMGADTVGVDVHPFLPALYSAPGDQGPVEGPKGVTGSVRLVHGRWPLGKGVADEVGRGFDVFLTKNTLKRGYVHPREKVFKRNVVDLKAKDAAFLDALHDCLKPGGIVLVYNTGFTPAGPGERYRPQDDIGCAFTKEQWEKHGFEVVQFDADDGEEARKHALAFGWFRGNAKAAERLQASFTIVRRSPSDR